ncbi:TadE/TadG family type IV pilus assembly protein [Loktanella sp. S4079]|uniref:TadE/TadG family type IV pilus assembly protein n=1 Tax=Loktanella sp. S4079 TaxID=579483 RepID=UPI0005FA21D1|nr:TadE/TadG family type IV pilus assembly protein [Loktanella sp. S4079]KJZ19775.1 hypothetical protein TW80_02470 [Loktanella sp. S4079]
MITEIRSFFRRFRDDDAGLATIEFVIIFPFFFAFFLMTFESGMIAVRQFMLERGVDIVVRDIRIGTLSEPSDERIRESICEVASIIPDCTNQVFVEMRVQDPEATWTALQDPTRCINRNEDARPATTIQHGSNNELVLMRVCARIDPLMPFSRIGRVEVPSLGSTIANNNSNAQAGGSYALVALSSYVVEPQ